MREETHADELLAAWRNYSAKRLQVMRDIARFEPTFQFYARGECDTCLRVYRSLLKGQLEHRSADELVHALNHLIVVAERNGI